MEVKIREGLHLSNPLGDGVDRKSGEVVDLDPSTAERWIAKGWAHKHEPSQSGHRSGYRKPFDLTPASESGES